MAPSPTPLLGDVGGLVMAAYHCHVNHGAKDLLHRVVATTLQFYPPLQRLLANHPTYFLLRLNAVLALKFTPFWFKTQFGRWGVGILELCLTSRCYGFYAEPGMKHRLRQRERETKREKGDKEIERQEREFFFLH